MKLQHKVYLILGSNINPVFNLQSAVDQLNNHGSLTAISSVWETIAVGSGGPNFLNAAVLFLTGEVPTKLKVNIIRPIEQSLGRIRSGDENAPRTIDIDILMIDEVALDVARWKYAYVIVPMAELLPDGLSPFGDKTLRETAAQLRKEIWITRRQDIPLSYKKKIS